MCDLCLALSKRRLHQHSFRLFWEITTETCELVINNIYFDSDPKFRYSCQRIPKWQREMIDHKDFKVNGINDINISLVFAHFRGNWEQSNQLMYAYTFIYGEVPKFTQNSTGKSYNATFPIELILNWPVPI